MPAAPASAAAQRSAATTSTWSFVIEQRYGDKNGAELANPQTIAVDGEGRLYVSDARPAAVKVFSADGCEAMMLTDNRSCCEFVLRAYPEFDATVPLLSRP